MAVGISGVWKEVTTPHIFSTDFIGTTEKFRVIGSRVQGKLPQLRERLYLLCFSEITLFVVFCEIFFVLFCFETRSLCIVRIVLTILKLPARLAINAEIHQLLPLKCWD